MLPHEMRNRYFQVGVLLASHRALMDARRGIENLERRLCDNGSLLSDWRVEYVGICALLRASVHLFQVDAKACHKREITLELEREWSEIKENKEAHTIYWEFINKERNLILKEYHWTSYEEYFDDSGDPIDAKDLSILTLIGSSSELIIKDGPFEGMRTLDLLTKAADWVHERLASALRRAGYELDDMVHFHSWSRMPKPDPSNTILGGFK